jgi:hypothetical protein
MKTRSVSGRCKPLREGRVNTARQQGRVRYTHGEAEEPAWFPCSAEQLAAFIDRAEPVGAPGRG